jgi:hypothetical protein
LTKKERRNSVTPNPFSQDGVGAVWTAFGVSGYWRAWYLKQNTVFYLLPCFDTESEAVNAARNAYGLASD